MPNATDVRPVRAKRIGPAYRYVSTRRRLQWDPRGPFGDLHCRLRGKIRVRALSFDCEQRRRQVSSAGFPGTDWADETWKG